MHKDIEKVLITKKQLQDKVEVIAAQLNKDYKQKNPIFVCILKGSVMFFADLVRALEIDVTVEFMAISSYGSASTSSGEVKVLKDLNTPVDGRDVVIVEDIIDTGVTLSYLLRHLLARGAASVEIAAMLNKPSRRKVDVPIKYIGFDIPDEFVVGYGLDYAEKYRNINSVCVLSRKVYEKTKD